MILNLFYGLLVMSACLVVQSFLVVKAIHFYIGREQRLTHASLSEDLLLVVCVMIILVLGNFIQVFVWSGLFLLLGEFTSIADAVYHSAVNFSTLGYGDIVMSDKHKLLGPLEAINGALMIGVSTASLLATFQHALRKFVGAKSQKE